MSEWQETTLGDVITLQRGHDLAKTEMQFGSIPVAGSNGVIGYHNKSTTKALGITIGRSGNIGNPHLYKEDFWAHNTTLYVKDFKGNDEIFVYYLLKSIDFAGFNVGSAVPTLNRNHIHPMVILKPLPEEQKTIASVLSSLDDKIDLLHRQNTTLEHMAETLFRQWFIEEAQEDWVEVKLGDFVEVNKKSISKYYPFNQIEYLDTGSLTEGKVDSLQPYMINEAPSRALRLVEHNDVLISTVRPNQKHYGIINNPIENLVVSSGFCVLTCTKIAPHFVYLLLTNNEMTEYLHSIAEGSTSTYPSLKPSDIAAITFQMPPNERLADFAKIANDSWEKVHQNYKQIQTLEKLRDNLLPKLMGGEVRVGIEGASE